MKLTTIPLLLLSTVSAIVQVPYIPDVAFIPVSNASRVTLTNRTCQQCLCASNFSHLILNCFPNGTCEFFAVSPRTYRIQSTPTARLYFPQGVYPNDSQCCMPNTTLLLSKLNATTPVQVTATSSRCLVVDNAGRLVTVSYSAKSILRFSPNSLATISTPASPIFNANPWSITHLNGAYYIGFDRWILVLNSSTLTQMHNISVSALSGTRDIIFLNSGQTMVVASTTNSRLLFFNRSSAISYNYNLFGSQNVSFAISGWSLVRQ